MKVRKMIKKIIGMMLITTLALTMISISLRAGENDFSEDIDIEEIDMEEIIDELTHIRRIDSDLSRLMAYDDFVDELLEIAEDREKRKDGIVARYKGDDDKETTLYEVEGPWQVEWKSEGRIFQLYIYDADDRRVSVAANQTRGGSGVYTNSNSGSFYLEIKAVGDWNLTIKENVEDS